MSSRVIGHGSTSLKTGLIRFQARHQSSRVRVPCAPILRCPENGGMPRRQNEQDTRSALQRVLGKGCLAPAEARVLDRRLVSRAATGRSIYWQAPTLKNHRHRKVRLGSEGAHPLGGLPEPPPVAPNGIYGISTLPITQPRDTLRYHIVSVEGGGRGRQGEQLRIAALSPLIDRV